MLSIVILTKNEEKNIIDCLETAVWADELIIVDDNSMDRTIDVINSLGNKKIKIYKNVLSDNFSNQRNFVLSKSTKDWVLFLDADERITSGLKEELNTTIINRENNISGYFIKRVDVMWDKLLNHGETGDIRLLRLAKRGTGAWVGKVHEKWQVDGEVGELDGQILHYPHQSINEFLLDINYYSSLRAQELFGRKVKAKVQDIMIYPIAKFFKNYLIKFGFLDGIEGLIFALMMSFHSFLVRGKLWLLWQKK